MNQRIILLLAILFGTSVIKAEVITGSCGNNLSYSLNQEDSTLLISGTGAMQNYDYWGSGWYPYRSYVKYVSLPNGLTTIGSHAFRDCDSILSIVIPPTVLSIENDAFRNCASLKTILGGDNVTYIGSQAFSSCSSLISAADLFQSIVTIESRAFSYCSALQSLDFGNNLTTLKNGAFANCTSLTSVTIPECVISIGGGAFRQCTSLSCVTINGGFTNTTSDDNAIFPYCSSLTSLIWNATDYQIPLSSESSFLSTSSESPYSAPAIYPQITSITIGGNVDTIPEKLFTNMSGLQSVTMLEGVKYVGKESFSSCSNLTSIVFPNSMTSIGEKGFSACTSFTSITLPDSITTIGNNAFSGCRSLTSITLPDSITTIGNNAFSGCRSLTSITLPNSITNIGNNAFSNCSSLEQISIPHNVTTFGYHVFKDCTSLSTVFWNARDCNVSPYVNDAPFYDIRKQITTFVFGDSVEVIPKAICYDMSSLGTMAIPSSVKSIQYNAFAKCSSLKSIFIPRNVISIDGRAFSYCDSICGIYISDLQAWCNIMFISQNPLCKVKNLYLNNELVTDLIIPNDITTVKSLAFEGCTSITRVTLPNSVVTIEGSAFKNCAALDSICFGTNTVTIGYGSFEGCSNLKSLTIPNSVTTIDDQAFKSCTALDSICIGTNATYIGNQAFGNCRALRSVTCLALTPPETHECERIFGYYDPQNPLSESDGWYFPQINIYVPEGSVAAYKADTISTCDRVSWGHYANYHGLQQALNVTTIDTIATVDVEISGITIKWPSVEGVETYSIEITKTDSMVHLYEMTSTGVVYYHESMSNAPSREERINMIQAITTINGLEFHISDLTEGESYSFCIISRNSEYEIIDTKCGYFRNVVQYNIRFINYDGSELQNDMVDKGTLPIYDGETPNRVGDMKYSYTFNGWSPEIVIATRNATYRATYYTHLNQYVITFLNEDSTLLQRDTLDYGMMPEYRGEDPVKPNKSEYFFVFAGWEPEIVAVTGDATYVATFESHGTRIDNVAEKQQPIKVLEDDKMYILMPDGTKYSATGKKVE